MIKTEEEIRERMRWEFEQAAAHFGFALEPVMAMEVMTYITFGTALGWIVGMTEEEIQAEVMDAAKWVHRENPKHLQQFLGGGFTV